MSFKYYVLTSGSIETLSRQFETLKTNETVVVINTLNDEYVDTATDFCMSNKIEHYVTKSDGTPATGKNSVLKLFLESDNEYMVHVDGDDMITPYGRNLYRTVALGDSPPDVICLYNQIGIDNYKIGLLDLFRKQVDSNRVTKEHMFIPPSYGPFFPHALDSSTRRYEPKITDGAIKLIKKQCDWLTEDEAKRWVENRVYLEEFALRYSDRRNTLNRLVFFSRKAASMMHYDSTLVVGEDLVQCHRLKKYTHDGELDMKIRNEYPKYSYLYFTDSLSITRKNFADWNWMEPLIEELNKIEPELPEFTLSEFKDPYYEVE